MTPALQLARQAPHPSDGLFRSQGVAAFEASRDPIALVLLDLTMPSLGGEEAFRAMRRLRSDVRVVLMSGYRSHELASRYGAEGLAGFIGSRSDSRSSTRA